MISILVKQQWFMCDGRREEKKTHRDKHILNRNISNENQMFMDEI